MKIKLIDGPQRDFVLDTGRYAAYIGGLGSGKTFAGLVKAIRKTQEKPTVGVLAPRGVVGTATFRNIEDVIFPALDYVLGPDWREGNKLTKGFKASQMRLYMRNGAEIWFRSLDSPNWMRGPELSWFFIDEGRNVGPDVWKIMVGRLRQPGYAQQGWVCSTPAGHDWMWSRFHPSSPDALPNANWYNASTQDNPYLADEYVADLKSQYSGRYLRQEFYGEFVGVMAGQVFPHWGDELLRSVSYDPSLPLYSFWDFGVADVGVVLFAQVSHERVDVYNENTGKLLGAEWIPHLRFLDYIEASDWGAIEWSDAWRSWLDRNTEGRRPDLNIGDPAGMARHAGAEVTSIIQALGAQGVAIQPAPKKPWDYAALILDNMMAGGRVAADRERCSRLGAAFASYHFRTDDDGNRLGEKPVHDWSSHFCDAARYGATVLFSHQHRRTSAPSGKPPPPGTMGYLLAQVDGDQEEQWLGHEPAEIDFGPIGRLAAR